MYTFLKILKCTYVTIISSLCLCFLVLFALDVLRPRYKRHEQVERASLHGVKPASPDVSVATLVICTVCHIYARKYVNRSIGR